MKTINVHEAKTQLSRLLERVERGEEIVIARAGTPVARLLPFTPPGSARELGMDEGRVDIPADFDAPLPPDVLTEFE